MQLQQWQQYLLSDSVSATLQLQEHVKPAGRLSTEQALAVYQNNCLGSRINALVEIYSTCFAVLGEGYFRQLARQYARVNMAVSTDLNIYGEGFAEFLQQQQRVELQDFLYLANLASLDKIVHDLHNVAEQAASDFALLGDADKLVYCHSRECQLRVFDYPVDKIWLDNRHSDGESIIEDQVAPYCVVIQCNDYAMQIQRIDPQEYTVLKALNNMSLPGLSNELAEDDVARLAEYLPRWIQSGWLCWRLA